MTDLVVVSLERWDDVWRRNQHLVSGLIANDPTLRVLFVEPAADPMHDLSERRRPSTGDRTARIHPESERLWTYRPTKWLPRRVDRGTDDRLARRIVRTARHLGMNEPALWINDPSFAGVSSISGWQTMYDMTDDWLSASRSESELNRVARGEQHLLRHAAEVVACSRELIRRKSPDRPPTRRPISLIPNAVDVAAYSAAHRRPSDLPAGRTAVYVGTLHPDRFDVELAISSAHLLGELGTLVLVGPNLLGAVATGELRRAGAQVLGSRSRDEVIAYLQHADVLVVPHVVTLFTESLDPIKLYEYQAVRKRIVSTAVAGFRETHDARIVLADGAHFADAIKEAFTAGRVDFESSPPPDWSERVTAMESVLRNLVDRVA